MITEVDIQTKIRELVTTNPVVLFMKGSKDFPMCGFSGRVIHIMRELNVDFVDFNVLEDESIRQGIKVYANWPTIPQLYVQGEFIGGCDIMNEMFESGELATLLHQYKK
jgi:monothiol glutaredoxin